MQAERPTQVRWLIFALACATSWLLYLHRYAWGVIVHSHDKHTAQDASLAVEREALEAVGVFDERFFAYHEDVDWSATARERGWRIVFIMPMLFMPSAVAFIWKLAFNDGRVISDLLGRLGLIEGNVDWLASIWLARMTLIVADVWQWTPFMFVDRKSVV